MLEIQAASTDQSDVHTRVNALFSDSFLIERPLLRALRPGVGGAPVLLIDELDRADAAFEAFLLEILSDWQITIPEIGTIAAAIPPVVIITSNRTREIHDALNDAALSLGRLSITGGRIGHFAGKGTSSCCGTQARL